VIVLDTSVVIAAMNDRDDDYELARGWMETQREQLLCTPLVVAELDHMVFTLGGSAAARGLREDLASGAYQVEWWSTATHETVALAERHDSMELGLTDASLLALAAHVDTTRIATLDERHFRALRPASGSGAAFTLLPADATS
jgi:hypothetical protein